MAYSYSNYPPYNPGYQQQYPGQFMMQPTAQMSMQMPQNGQQMGQGISQASRLVSNKDEANAVQADFSGAMMLFPDVTHNKIYLKRWNMGTGAAEFAEFVPAIPETIEQTAQAFDPSEQFDELKGILDGIKKDIEQLKKPVSSGKTVKKNDTDE